MSMDGCISERRREWTEVRLRWRAARWFGLVCAAATTTLAAAAPTAKVTDVRFWTAGDTTRVAIEVTGEFQYKSQRLQGPERVFFDLEKTQLGLKNNRPTAIPVKDGMVKQVRLAENNKTTVRVVLDLEEGVEFTVSQLSNPERLMVELSSKKRKPATPAKTAPAPVPTSAPKSTRPMDTKSAPKPAEVAVKESKAPEVATVETVSADSPIAGLIPPVFASIAGSAAPVVAANIAPVVRQTPQPEPPPLPAAETTKAPAANLPEPKPAARNSNGERSLTRVLGLKLQRIVIDPGHGGHDQGTHSKSGMLEKDLVLDVSSRLAELLRTRMGTEVIMTRTDDTYLSLEERTRMANDGKADLFLSIHANSSPVKSVAGVETFYLNFNTGRDDSDLATRENAASGRTIADLKEMVSKIALRAKLDESREFALRVQSALHSTAAKQNKEAKDRGVKRAPFVVLIGAEMPSVLAEIGFLSNTRDEALLKGPEHRNRIAEALYKAIEGYNDSLGRTSELTRASR